jgi:hypothetical protein
LLDKAPTKFGEKQVGFRASGLVELAGAHVGGDLVCSGGQFDSDGEELALSFIGAEIKGSVYLNRGFRAKGTVQLAASNISGDLSCQSGRFAGLISKAAGGKEDPGPALVGNQADIRGRVFLRRKPGATKAVGQFQALGAISFCPNRRLCLLCRGEIRRLTGLRRT